MRPRVSATVLAAAHARAVHRDLSVDLARDDPGARTVTRERRLGAGPDVLAAAASGLLTFAMHRAAGVDVLPGASAVEGATVVLGLGVGRVALTAPCRVVERWCDARRAGFTYATVRGHPEAGWERFAVELDDDGEVRLRIDARSRPAWRLLRLASPVQDRAQDLVTAAYLRSLGRIVQRA